MINIPLDAEQRPRRIKRVSVMPDLLLSWLLAIGEKPRTYSSIGLPADARLVSTVYDVDVHLIRLYIESETYPPLLEGTACQDIDVSLTEHHVQVAAHQ